MIYKTLNKNRNGHNTLTVLFERKILICVTYEITNKFIFIIASRSISNLSICICWDCDIHLKKKHAIFTKFRKVGRKNVLVGNWQLHWFIFYLWLPWFIVMQLREGAYFGFPDTVSPPLIRPLSPKATPFIWTCLVKSS